MYIRFSFFTRVVAVDRLSYPHSEVIRSFGTEINNNNQFITNSIKIVNIYKYQVLFDIGSASLLELNNERDIEKLFNRYVSIEFSFLQSSDI